MYKLLLPCCFVLNLTVYSMEMAAHLHLNQVEVKLAQIKFDLAKSVAEIKELKVNFDNSESRIEKLKQRESPIRKWRRQRVQQKLAAQQQKKYENETYMRLK